MSDLEAAWSDVSGTWVRVLGALVLLVSGWLLARGLGRLVTRAVQRSPEADPTLAPFLGQFVRVALLLCALTATLSALGVEMTSVVALLGAAGVTVGLALQGLLSNLMAGLALMAFRPFRVGDEIEVASTTGTVRVVGMFSTELTTSDNVHVFVPNARIWGTEIRNFARLDVRRCEVQVPVPNGAPADALLTRMVAAVAGVEGVAREPAAEGAVVEVRDGHTLLRVRFWTETRQASRVRELALASARRVGEDAGIWSRG
jgi:small conductance mechanosensitive channel